MSRLTRMIGIWLVGVTLALGAVDRIEVTSRKLLLEGKAFGAAGSYEVITGKVYFKVKSDESHNRVIVDLANAKPNARGEVEFSADVWLARPTVMEKGNGALLLEIPNRGRRFAMFAVGGGSGIDPAKESDWGDGWLLRQGYTVGTLGWQWDLPEAPGTMRLSAPVAYAPDGTSLTGLVRDDFTLSEKAFDVALEHRLAGSVGGIEYPVSDPNDSRNGLTVRDAPTSERHKIPRLEWSFGYEKESASPGPKSRTLIVDTKHVHLSRGFEPGKIYEFVYVAQDPVVAGLGLAAVRDFASYLKNDKNEIAAVARVYGIGFSQTGRFLRHFLYQGFNADEQGRQVLDGVMAVVAGAGRGSFNHRFAQPSRDASPMSSFFYPTDIFPFTDLPEYDSLTGVDAGVLDAARAAHVVPKIFYANTSYEYWGRVASLTHTTPDGLADAEFPATTRSYFFTGLEHFPAALPPNRDVGGIVELKGQNLENPNPNWWLYRAMISNMNAWVRDGVEPPANAYPKIKDRTLVPIEKVRFPKIAGVRFPDESSHAWSIDFGKTWSQGIIDQQPPLVISNWPILLPQVDEDGNEIAGVRIPEISVPVATYTGWNFRDPSIGAPEQRVAFVGSYFPFALTREQRAASGDPRASLDERYASEEEYLKRYRGAAEELVKARWILAEDLRGVMGRGKQEWQVAHENLR